MSRLPVIVGFGGINPAGRSSAHHAYRRLVIDKLDSKTAARTWASLATLMELSTDSTLNEDQKQYIRNHTLIRRLESNLFDPQAIRLNKRARLMATPEGPVSFTIKRNQLPDLVPQTWKVEPLEDAKVKVTVGNELDVLFPDTRTSRVKSAGQLPSGFEPEKMYQSRNHPRGLQLTIYGASDAINSLGIDWETVRSLVPADQISVYASSAMGQLDTNGSGGMLQASLMGRRVSSKNCPLGLAEMTADFINAYILGNVGCTGANIGACATFLYNLRQGIQDIQSGKYRAAIVGASEAPLTPEIIEGYRTMGALAEDEALRKLDHISDGSPEYRRACRPFSDNCGFTLSEAAQFVILFDDDLALELGANIYGSVGDVFINADGFKKSIPGPGIGNYVTMGKAMGMIRSLLGDESLRRKTFVQAHGTGTPQNRVTESHIFNEMAKCFGIEHWPIAAIKAYLGHSLGSAAGDQLTVSLGVWAHGLIPGIKTIDHLAEDVHQSHLDFLLDHREVARDDMDASLINSKGFGGNNSTAAILAPHVTRQMLEKRHGKDAMKRHAERNEKVQENLEAYDHEAIAGKNTLIYNFGINVVEGEQLKLSAQRIDIPGYEQPVSLEVPNPYDDMV